MILLEGTLTAIMLCTCACLTYTDFKTGLIPNRILGISGAAVCLLDCVYYIFFLNDGVAEFIVNAVITGAFSLLLYCFHFWGAGDSKMMIFIVLSIPVRFYHTGNVFGFPAIAIIVQTFSIAFVYLIFESVILGIKNRDFFKSGKTVHGTVGEAVYNYILSYLYIMIFSSIEKFILNYITISNEYIIPLVNFFLILTVLRYDVFRRKTAFAAAVIINIIISLISPGKASFIPSPLNIILIIVIMIFRRFADKYNYKIIPTESIKKGDVLAMSTVLLFVPSRVKGLPTSTTEDFRSRLSEEEAQSIRRWENSAYGAKEITVVKKLPFAVFITASTVCFLGMRVIL